jgi:hypothetical protein
VRGAPEAAVVDARVAVMVTVAVTPARSPRVLPLASSSPSSVVASVGDAVLRLSLKRFSSHIRSQRLDKVSSSCRNFTASQKGIGYGCIRRNERMILRIH